MAATISSSSRLLVLSSSCLLVFSSSRLLSSCPLVFLSSCPLVLYELLYHLCSDDFNIIYWTVILASGHVLNLVNNIHASYHFAKHGVRPIEMRCAASGGVSVDLLLGELHWVKGIPLFGELDKLILEACQGCRVALCLQCLNLWPAI